MFLETNRFLQIKKILTDKKDSQRVYKKRRDFHQKKDSYR